MTMKPPCCMPNSWDEIPAQQIGLPIAWPRDKPTELHFKLQDGAGTWSAKVITVDKSRTGIVPFEVRTQFSKLSQTQQDEVQAVYNRLDWQLQALRDIERLLPLEVRFYNQAPHDNILDQLFANLAPLLETPSGQACRSKKFKTLLTARDTFRVYVLTLLRPV